MQNHYPATTPETDVRRTWGIIGGLGPYASAEFLTSIYEAGHGLREQNLPIVYLLSDPSFPDRTEIIESGDDDILLLRLANSLTKLNSLGVEQVIICCMTIHSLLNRLPSSLKVNITSLADVALSAVRGSSGSHLLLCTKGSRKSRLFEQHSLWHEVRSKIVIPDDNDQEAIHSMIYEIKMDQKDEKHATFLEHLLEKYGLNSFVAGCTELHVFMKRQRHLNRLAGCIDPLQILATWIATDSLSMYGLPETEPVLDSASVIT